ncbi:MAG: hypothetical protein KKC66_04605 [Candidatus Omnitrophica bacterium]|nr:hypothetical protein [Candidatus Omnitrophota bacterium]MBU1933160.1 hypothetical protein [Candidatus Omnitrophota bacterium]
MPEDIRSVNDLHKIPITTKSCLRDLDIREIISKNARPDDCIKMITSGESGIPFEFYLGPEEYDYWKLLLLRFHMANGMRLTDKCTVLAYPLRFPKNKRWFQRLGVLRHIYISALDPAKKYTDKIIKSNPDVILGYASALKLFAKEAEKRKDINIRPKSILSSGEMLDSETRFIVKKTFGIQIADLYSVIETGPIAWECPFHEGYHINIDSVVLECVKNGKIASYGEKGRLICTNLFNFTMPMIRYSVNDVAVLTKKTCSCGRGFPLLEKIEGRSLDFITLPDDRVISPAVILIMLRRLIGQAQHKVIQKEKDKILIQLVPGKNFREESIASLKREMQKELNAAINIDVEIVEEIKKSRSGKMRSVISEVANNL